MERQIEREEQQVRRPEVVGWEQVPTDGPAVLVVNARLLDQGIGHVGGWVRLDAGVPEVVERIGQILGNGGGREDYVVIDQLGIGDSMWDEHEVADLLSLAKGSRFDASGATAPGGRP